jgi:predicted glycoside hydrolase/deacetylase ChbG (UPF0249 family)
MIPAIFPIVAAFARERRGDARGSRGCTGLDCCGSTDGFSSAFYGEEISKRCF